MEAQSAQARLNTCRNTSELRSLLSELCSGLAEVLNVTTLCGNGRDNMMCVVDFFPGTPDLAGLAERIGVPETLLLEAALCLIGVLGGIRYYMQHRQQIPAEQRVPLLSASGGK